MISIQNLSVKFSRELYALSDINLEIDKGCFLIVGETSSGKTTLLRVLAGCEKISSGNIFLDGIPYSKINFAKDFAVSYLPLTPLLVLHKTVKENLLYILKITGFKKEERLPLVEKTIGKFGLESLAERKAASLTRFEKYLVSLARMFMKKRDLVLIDDVFADLIPEEAQKLGKIIKDEFFSENFTLVLASKREDVLKSLSPVIFKMENGTLVV